MQQDGGHRRKYVISVVEFIPNRQFIKLIFIFRKVLNDSSSFLGSCQGRSRGMTIKAGPHSIIPLLYNPTTKAFFSDMGVVHNLVVGSSAILIGGMILIMGLTLKLFLYKTPQKYQVEYYYRRLFTGFLTLCSLAYKTIVYAGELVITKLMVYSWMPMLKIENVISHVLPPKL